MERDTPEDTAPRDHLAPGQRSSSRTRFPVIDPATLDEIGCRAEVDAEGPSEAPRLRIGNGPERNGIRPLPLPVPPCARSGRIWCRPVPHARPLPRAFRAQGRT